MPQPILCLDEEVYHFAKRFDALLSKPHYQYLSKQGESKQHQ